MIKILNKYAFRFLERNDNGDNDESYKEKITINAFSHQFIK